MNLRPTFHFADALALTAGVSSLAAWQEQVDFWLRITAAIVAIAAGLVTLYQRLRKRRQDAAE